MQSSNDRVICVPIQDDDVIKNVTSLPRTSANDGYITVNLKRMKSLKKNEMQEIVQPEQLLDGLEYLRQNHPAYKDVIPNDIIEEFLEVEGNNETLMDMNDSFVKAEFDDSFDDDVKMKRRKMPTVP